MLVGKGFHCVIIIVFPFPVHHNLLLNIPGVGVNFASRDSNSNFEKCVKGLIGYG